MSNQYEGPTVKIRPDGVSEGDKFINAEGKHIWTALHNPRMLSAEVHIDVQFVEDGGCSTRVWDADGNITLNVIRA